MPRLRFLFTNAVKHSLSFVFVIVFWVRMLQKRMMVDTCNSQQFIYNQIVMSLRVSFFFFKKNRVNVLFLRIYCLVEDGEAEVALPLWNRETSSFIATLSATLR